MTSPLTISAGAERMALDASGRAEMTFTVTNNGPIDQRIVLDIVPSETADELWFSIVEPQVLVPHGGSVSYDAKIAAPAGTTPDRTGWPAAPTRRRSRHRGARLSATGWPSRSRAAAPQPPWWNKPPWWKK